MLKRSRLVEVKDSMGIILYTVLVLGSNTKRQTQKEQQTPLPVESCPLSLRVLLSNPGLVLSSHQFPCSNFPRSGIACEPQCCLKIAF